MLKLRTSKKFLLVFAGLVWFFAGCILIFKGFSFGNDSINTILLKVGIGIAGGMLFYYLLFIKISHKHTQRIITLANEKPYIFEFFNLKSYLMMGLMIGMGILFRRTGIFPINILSCFYVVMGIPLLLSAFRFFYGAKIFNKKI